LTRNIIRTLALKIPALARLKDRISALQLELSVETAGRQAAIAQRDAFEREKDNALGLQAETAAARDQAIAQKNDLVIERDNALAQRDKIIAELATVTDQRNGLVAERDHLLAERDKIIAELTTVTNQRNGLVLQRDEAIGHRIRAAKELDEAVGHRIKAIEERDEAIGHRIKAAEERDRADREKNQMVATMFGDGAVTREFLMYNYWATHPRYRFFKSLPSNATLLDVGAGSGGTAIWREWGNPHRMDIRLFGFDLPPDENNHAWDHTAHHLYEKWQYGNLETTPLDFDDGFFDAAMFSNVLEHVENPFEILANSFAKLKPGARVYIEIPTPASKNLPTAVELAAREMPVMVANFYDDSTHIETYTLTTIAEAARQSGYIVDEGGIVRNPFLEDKMFRYGLENHDSELLLHGYWSATGWVQYLILQRPHESGSNSGSIQSRVEDRSLGNDVWI
jgi:SAM-dependent methyltransferase